MTDVKVRNIPDWALDVHKSLAAQKGQSLEAYFRDMLTEGALQPQKAFAAELKSLLEKTRQRYGNFPEGFSTQLIREDRDTRG